MELDDTQQRFQVTLSIGEGGLRFCKMSLLASPADSASVAFTNHMQSATPGIDKKPDPLTPELFSRGTTASTIQSLRTSQKSWDGPTTREHIHKQAWNSF